MAEAKTRPTGESVTAFLKRATDGDQREDCAALVRMMKQAAGAPGKMYGANIVGFGSYTYTYASGRTGDWPIVAFAPRRQHVTLYLMGGHAKATPLLKKLGKHKMSGGCLHIKQLRDVDVNVLERLIAASVAQTKKQRA